MKTIIISDPIVKKEQHIYQDVRQGWLLGQQLCHDYVNLSASALYFFSVHLAASFGWKLASAHCGYLITGAYSQPAPIHMQLQLTQAEKKPVLQYIADNNREVLRLPCAKGVARQWMYRLHFCHPAHDLEAVYEEVLRFS